MNAFVYEVVLPLVALWVTMHHLRPARVHGPMVPTDNARRRFAWDARETAAGLRGEPGLARSARGAKFKASMLRKMHKLQRLSQAARDKELDEQTRRELDLRILELTGLLFKAKQIREGMDVLRPRPAAQLKAVKG